MFQVQKKEKSPQELVCDDEQVSNVARVQDLGAGGEMSRNCVSCTTKERGLAMTITIKQEKTREGNKLSLICQNQTNVNRFSPATAPKFDSPSL
jgi:hypothetical protein